MKTILLTATLCSLAALAGGCAEPPMKAADASPRVMCRDGTTMSHNNECGGHGGIDRHATAEHGHALRERQALGAGHERKPGEVWATPAAKTYYCRDASEYGNSKEGQYLSEADARAKGFHPAGGKNCAS
jgi:hypothetical protein